MNRETGIDLTSISASPIQRIKAYPTVNSSKKRIRK